jgi:hypothetical protein
VKRNLLIAAFIAALPFLGGATAFAQHDHQEIENEMHSPESDMQEAKNDDVARDAADDSRRDATKAEVLQKVADKKQQIEDRKAELRSKMEAKVAERKAKLEGKRLDQCQKRQETINALLVTSAGNASRHVENIQRFKQRVQEFADKQTLASDELTAALTDAETKEAQALAAVEFSSSVSFDCANVDASKPAETLRLSNQEKRTAVSAYRDSVLTYLKAVKAAFVEKKQASEGNGA